MHQDELDAVWNGMRRNDNRPASQWHEDFGEECPLFDLTIFERRLSLRSAIAKHQETMDPLDAGVCERVKPREHI